MSQIKVNQIAHSDNVSPVVLGFGATCSSGQIFSIQGGVSISGICTASSFVGDGSQLTNLPSASVGQIVSTIITGVGG